MNFELALITLAVWFFLAKKFSNWTWVTALTDIFPGPVKALGKAWMVCSFCGGFWIALALRGVTGWQTLPALSRLHFTIDWPLDALATAMLVTIVALPLEVIISKVKKIRQDEENTADKSTARLPPPRTQGTRTPSPQQPQGPQRSSGGRNFQRGRGPRRPNPRPKS